MVTREESLDLLGRTIQRAESGDVITRDALLTLMGGTALAIRNIVEMSPQARLGEIRTQSVDSAGSRHSFGVSHGGLYLLANPSMWTITPESAPYLSDNIVIPSDKVIEKLRADTTQFIGKDNWYYSERFDIYAVSGKDTSGAITCDRYWPFHVEDEATQVHGYCQVFGRLAQQLVDIA